MATNTSDFFTFSKTAGTAKNLQKPTDGGDNNLWGGYINVDLDTIVGAVNATSDLIADANQNELVDFTATGSAVNHVGITNAATGNGPTIEAKGDDSNVDLNVKPKGTGAILLKDGDGNELVKTSRTASAVNEITVANAATGNGPTLSATGDDTNIDLNIAGKGTGEIEIASNIAFSNDTDAKIKLPSGGGIYESDGSTEILTESSGAVTLKNTTIDSTVTFRTGQIIACKQWIDASGNTTVNSNSLTALNESSASQNSFSATSGNSYLLSFTGTISIASDGSSVANRSGGLQLRYGTTAIADEETSLPDTALAGNFKEFSDNTIGRNLIGANSATATVYVPISLEFIFTATSTATYYFNLVGNAGNVRNMVMFKTSNNPLVTRYFEIQGDVTA